MKQARPARNFPPFALPDRRKRPVLALVAAAALAGCAGDAPIVMKRSPEAAAADAAARQRLLSGSDTSTAAAGLWPGPGHTPYPYPLVDPHRARLEAAVLAAAPVPAAPVAVLSEPAPAATVVATIAQPAPAAVAPAQPALQPPVAAALPESLPPAAVATVMPSSVPQAVLPPVQAWREEAPAPVRRSPQPRPLAWAMAADGPMVQAAAVVEPAARPATGGLWAALAGIFGRGRAGPAPATPVLAQQAPPPAVADLPPLAQSRADQQRRSVVAAAPAARPAARPAATRAMKVAARPAANRGRLVAGKAPARQVAAARPAQRAAQRVALKRPARTAVQDVQQARLGPRPPAPAAAAAVVAQPAPRPQAPPMPPTMVSAQG